VVDVDDDVDDDDGGSELELLRERPEEVGTLVSVNRAIRFSSSSGPKSGLR
jgi:hypothetical protein